MVGGLRRRATAVEMEERRAALCDIVHGGAPMSVRHAFYQAVGLRLVPKTHNGYMKVQREILRLRRDGLIGYADIVDGTRRSLVAAGVYDNLSEALYETSRTYRRNLWSSSPYRLEVWCESDSISGTVQNTVLGWTLPLFVTRGYASETFLWSSAQHHAATDRNVVVLYIGDYDPHGVLIETTAQERLLEFSGVEVEWRRLAVTPEQVSEYGLPTSYGGHGVEAEALDADVLRETLESAILEYVDQDQLAVLESAEESEREILWQIVQSKGGGA